MFLSEKERLSILRVLEDQTKCTPEQLIIRNKLINATERIEVRTFKFLNSNHLDINHIPTIDELGKLKGGYALVKSISQAGGMKKFRKIYSAYLKEMTPDWMVWDEESLSG